MSSQKLKNAPLKEVIFELHWKLILDDAGVPHDPGFELAVGKFADKLKSDFPVHRKLPTADLPFAFIGAPIHQYWRGDLVYPVVQHGKGMIAVNEVEAGYVWADAFRPLIFQVIDDLVASYDSNLTFNKLVLKYVDAVDLIGGEAQEFAARNLQTEIILHYPVPGSLRDFQIHQVFELRDGSMMNLNITTGTNNQTQQKAVIWSTVVEKRGDFAKEEIERWVDYAHDESSAMFKKMLDPEYYASLDR